MKCMRHGCEHVLKHSTKLIEETNCTANMKLKNAATQLKQKGILS